MSAQAAALARDREARARLGLPPLEPAAPVVALVEVKQTTRCVYCGHLITRGDRTTCHAHSDLPELEASQ